jgi:hypothetical protein
MHQPDKSTTKVLQTNRLPPLEDALNKSIAYEEFRRRPTDVRVFFAALDLG